jgi:hypothetical protein
VSNLKIAAVKFVFECCCVIGLYLNVAVLSVIRDRKFLSFCQYCMSLTYRLGQALRVPEDQGTQNF